MRHYLYLIERNPRRAERFWNAVHAVMKRISQHPQDGAAIAHPDFSGLELRFVKPAGFSEYLMIYQVTDDAAFLLRILHRSQNFESELRPK
jgi:plasmid stabilization system protein ParE